MTILHIIASSVNWGGMEQYALDVALGAIERGHKVVFVARDDGDVIPNRLGEHGFKPYLLPFSGKFDFKFIKKLRKIVIDNSVDVIHTHQPRNIFHAIFAVNGLGVRVVHTVHFVINWVSPHFLYRWVFRKVNVMIAVSKIVGDKVVELYSNCDNVVVIHNSIDPTRVQGVKAADNEVVTIGYAGRIVDDKGIFTFVDAVKILNERGVGFRAMIAGTGFHVERLNSDIAGVSNIDYVGFERNIGQFIEKLDVAVLPSIVVEAISLMVVEYMACSRAVVVSNYGGQTEILEDGVSALFFEADNAVDLADKLQFLIADKAARDAMGAAAKKTYVERLDFNDFIQKTIATYQ